MDRLRVRLDIPRLTENFSREEKRIMPNAEIAQWLSEAGFVRESEDTWIVNEADLGQLDPSEVLHVERLIDC